MFSDLSDEQFVEKIFTSGDQLSWDYVEEARKRSEHIVPRLCAVLRKEDNYTSDDQRFWCVVHALYILGIMADLRAIEALICAGKFADTYEIDWILDALPECYLRMGKDCIPALFRYMETSRTMSTPVVASEALGLWNIWEAFPETRSQIEAFFLSLIESHETSLEIKTNLIADFAKIGRWDLKTFLEGFYERGETDLNIFTWEDIERLFEEEDRPTLARYELEEFYSPVEITRRQKIWQQERARLEREAVNEFIIQNYKNIGRHQQCPCGSGRLFQHCHLDWAENQILRLKEKGRELSDSMMREMPVVAERLYENELRRFLAGKHQTGLFAELKKKVLELIHAPLEDYISGSFVRYFEPVFAQIGFDGEKDYKQFMKSFMEYFNALSRQRGQTCS